MTYEELKEEAAKQGYCLVRKSDKDSLKSCICGYKRRKLHVCGTGVYYKCSFCGTSSEVRDTVSSAQRAWNKKMEELAK